MTSRWSFWLSVTDIPDGTVIKGNDVAWMTMTQSYGTSKVDMERLASKEPHELLIMLGAALTILLTFVLFVVEWSQGITDSQLARVTTFVVTGVVLGAALWVSAAIAKKNRLNGALVAAVVSVVLIALGGLAGTIGGILGLLGAILAVASPYLASLNKD